MNNEQERQQDNSIVIDRILSGARWATLFRIVTQIVSWGCTIIVVRFISTGDYGLYAMLESPMELLFLASIFGLDSALVRAKAISQEALRSSFGWLLLINGLLFLGYFFSAPLIAAYFNAPRLERLAQTLTFVFLLIPFRAIPDALLDRDLKFKLKAFAGLIASLTGAITTLILAVLDAGVWALIIGLLTNRILLAIILMIFQPWFILPSLAFRPVREILVFGGIMALASAVAITGNMLPAIIAGPVLGPQALGIFSVSLQFALLPLAKAMPVINPIIFPAFSKFQGQPVAIARYLEKTAGFAALVLLPGIIGLACVAKDFVEVVLGYGWAPATVPLTLLALAVPFRGLTSFIRQVLGGIGHPRLALQSTIFTFALFLSLIVAGIGHGVTGLVIAVLVTEPTATVVTILLARRVINTSFAGIAKSLTPAVGSSAIMAAAVTGIRLLLDSEPGIVLLTAEIAAGAITYLFALQTIFGEKAREAIALIRRQSSTSGCEK
ncbi:lipopolysaccharide biosynthesis protein [Propionivibrio limicola]|uniref:lipopolysaccharide biosynthesis protein n=1 Tax=Propionivibrio limicola TaxID=167645 RepID=UPI001291CE0A|nr:lipopolysaccharide biosynthesis protein [Propionivibrio limicola]